MRVRAFLSALLLAIPVVTQAQDTTAIKALLAKQKPWIRDSIDRDKTRPAYVKKAQDSALAVQSQILTAMRKPAKPDTIVPPPPQTVASIEIHATATTLPVGGTLQLYAAPKDSAGNTLTTPVSWSATPLSIGTISGTGLLTGVAPGVVNVAAVSNGKGTLRAFTVTGVSPPDTAPTPPDTVPTPPVSGGFDGVAELPRSLPTPVYSAPCAVTVAIAASMDLQQAINMIQPGGCLALAPGATFAGNFTLPAKTGNAWVTIFTSGVQLPSPGTRMTPTLAASLKLAKISQPNYSPAISVAAGAHHYRFVGVEITPTTAAQTTGVNMIVALYDQSAQWSIAGLAHDIQFIHVYVHGSSTLDVKRCMRLDARYVVVVDSWLSDCHSNQTDSQGLLFISGGAFVLARNNHIEGGHQAFMSGGGDPPDSTLQPHDIALIGNHMYHPAAWKGVWQAKTMIETKDVRRLLIEGNVIENTWADAQAGFCFLEKSENQNNTAPWTTTSDVVIRYNLALRCGSVFNFSGKGSSSNPNIPMSRVVMHDVRADSVNYFANADGIGGQLLSGAIDVQVQKVTITNGLAGKYSNQGLSFDGAPQQRFVFDANIIGHGQYGVKGAGTGDGTATLNTFAPGAVFTNNAIVAGCGTYPATNSCPATLPAPSITLGADMTALAQKIAGVVVTDPLMGLRLRGAAQLKVKHPAPNLVCQSAKYGQLPMICDRPIQP